MYVIMIQRFEVVCKVSFCAVNPAYVNIFVVALMRAFQKCKTIHTFFILRIDGVGGGGGGVTLVGQRLHLVLRKGSKRGRGLLLVFL